MKSKIYISKIAEFLGTNFNGENYVIEQAAPLNVVNDNMITFSKSNVITKNLHKKILILTPLDYIYDDTLPYSIIKVKNPRLAFAKVLNNFFVTKKSSTIDKSVKIGTNCKIDSSVFIGMNCCIGNNVKIGSNTVINNNVVISDNTKIGNNCYIKSGVILGEEGLGFDFEDDGTPIRIPHIGNIEIGDNVEIGANTVIARGTLESTIIEDDVKIDDLVFIAHNCIIKKKTIIVAFAQISGSVSIGEKCWIGPNSSIIQKVTIGNNVTIGIGTIVTKDVEANKKIMGLTGLELRKLSKLKKRIAFGE